MPDPDEKVTRGGQTLTARVWALVADVERELGLDLEVVQGGFKNGGGAAASGSTHDVGDVLDIRAKTIPRDRQVDVVVAFRRRNVCMWLRDPAHGWTETGPHFHGVVRDSAWGLSAAAQWQVDEYDYRRNGLSGSSSGPDPFPRPAQHPFTLETDVALTADEIEKIAQRTAQLVAPAVWAHKITTGFQPDGTFDRTKPNILAAAGLLAASYGKSIQAAQRAGAPVDTQDVADAVLDGLGDRLRD
jgi:hypothetical protein